MWWTGFITYRLLKKTKKTKKTKKNRIKDMGVEERGLGEKRPRSTSYSESPLCFLLTEVVCPVNGQSYSECLGTLLSPVNGVLKSCDLIPSLRVPSPLLRMETWSWTEGWSCSELIDALLISAGGLKANKGTSYLF